MGIHVYFFRATNEEIARIQYDKEKIFEFLDQQSNIENNPKELWIEKAWEGIHYLLYKRKWFNKKDLEHGTLLYGYALNPNIYEGYGTPLLQFEENVESICKHLTSFSKEELKKRYNTREFSKLDIYPFDDRWNDDSEGNLEYLIYYWEELCKFYQKAVKENELVLVYWS